MESRLELSGNRLADKGRALLYLLYNRRKLLRLFLDDYSLTRCRVGSRSVCKTKYKWFPISDLLLAS